MADRKKVIKGMEQFRADLKQFCGNHADWDRFDAGLSMLKEQEEQIKNRDESLEKAREEIKWLRGMLKEQEAVKPVEEFAKGTNRHDYHCKRCGNIVGTIFDDKHPISPGAKLSIKHFCDVCGQAVKWE